MQEALFMLGGLGLVVGIGLALASKIFYVYVDPKILSVEDALPGANCGGCGLPGCSANAEAIVAGRAAPNSCVVAGLEVAEEIAGIMGVTVEAKEPDIARPGCTYGVQDADLKYFYDGMNDCRAVALLSGGMKVCTIGCLGLGTCARVCPFDAISMGPEGLPVVNEKKCTGCGTCERACPKYIINLSSITRRILREYTTNECTTPCQRACPAGIDICEYIRQISRGDYRRAVQVVKERNPFPTVIGRICPRPCELECRRNYIDEPVAINYLKRYAADYEIDTGQRVLPYRAPASGRKIAVVGGGVEGLSTAFFTARLGHETTVFEATDTLGGLLRQAIDRYRLPEQILDWDIDGILEIGVEARTHQLLGSDFSIDSLLEQGFEAVFLALGGWDSRVARSGGAAAESPIPGTYLLLDFIKHGNGENSPIACQSPVVIVGGGKLALEAARKCRAQGAKNITILYRESMESTPLADTDIKDLDPDIQIVFDSGISRLFGKNDRLTALEKIDLNTFEKEQIPATSLIFAAGRFPELIFVRAEPEQLESDADQHQPIGECGNGPFEWLAMEPYKRPAFRTETGLFARGDAISDYSGAIKAIGAGRRAAASIHEVLYGITLTLPENVVTDESEVQNVDRIHAVTEDRRRIMPLCPPKDLPGCGEIEKGFTEDMARSEADRCLRCGLICYERAEGWQQGSS
jgi:NADPH-dependent glutamate synthase beta subunit-like oxidoreductase